jgi:hypothetical protein
MQHAFLAMMSRAEPWPAARPGFPLLKVKGIELGRHLVVERERLGTPGAAFEAHGLDVGKAERKQHGFLDPLMGDPLLAVLFGDAQLARVQTGNHLLDGRAQRFGRIPRVDVGPVFPGLFDDVFHRLPASCIMRCTASTHSASGATSATRT